MEDKPYTMHSFQVGGAASHYRDGTAIDALVEYVGWQSALVAHRYVGATASADAAEVKRSHETEFLEADNRPLSEPSTKCHAALPRDN